jgi:hypothetical protein
MVGCAGPSVLMLLMTTAPMLFDASMATQFCLSMTRRNRV